MHARRAHAVCLLVSNHTQSLRPMTPSHTRYALASNDSPIRHWSLLLLWRVSSAAWVTSSFCLGTQLACSHSALGRKALWGFCPNLIPAMYMPTNIVRSMYIARSSLRATVAIELHGWCSWVSRTNQYVVLLLPAETRRKVCKPPAFTAARPALRRDMT